MRKSGVRRKDPERDPDDVKRRRDLLRDFQKKEHQHFSATPSVRQVRNHEHFNVNLDGTRYIYIRDGDDLYRVELTKVT